MRVYIDTSAYIAVLDKSDSNHEKAGRIWKELLEGEALLYCSNYVLVESFALIQHRLGLKAVTVFNDDILPLVHVDWADKMVHHTGVNALLAASRKKLSLVDCISFETMRRLEIDTAFTFDKHFAEQGFSLLS